MWNWCYVSTKPIDGACSPGVFKRAVRLMLPEQRLRSCVCRTPVLHSPVRACPCASLRRYLLGSTAPGLRAGSNAVRRAECEVKSLGQARNGTAGRDICVPKGSPATPLTLDDLQEYNECASETSNACRTAQSKFEAATGCGAKCDLDFQKWNDRTATYCADVQSEEACAVYKAPCSLPKSSLPPPPAPGPRVGPVVEPNTRRTIPPAPPRADRSGGNGADSGGSGNSGNGGDMKGGGGGSKGAAIGGGVAGGVLALVVLAAFVALLLRKRSNDKKAKDSALAKDAPGRDGASTVTGDGSVLPNGMPPGPYPYHGQWAASGHPSSGSGFGGPGSASGPWGASSGHGGPASSVCAWPTGPSLGSGSMSGWNSGGMQCARSLGSNAKAPAERVKVTYLPSKGTLDVTQASTLFGPTMGAQSLSSLSETSSPQQILDAQLDYVEQARNGVLSGTIQCAAPFLQT
jgi:uncharacterized membrane protein YgcG